jgi:FtsZ-interacting cell division protein ZipA
MNKRFIIFGVIAICVLAVFGMVIFLSQKQKQESAQYKQQEQIKNEDSNAQNEKVENTEITEFREQVKSLPARSPEDEIKYQAQLDELRTIAKAQQATQSPEELTAQQKQLDELRQNIKK